MKDERQRRRATSGCNPKRVLLLNIQYIGYTGTMNDKHSLNNRNIYNKIQHQWFRATYSHNTVCRMSYKKIMPTFQAYS